MANSRAFNQEIRDSTALFSGFPIAIVAILVLITFLATGLGLLSFTAAEFITGLQQKIAVVLPHIAAESIRTDAVIDGRAALIARQQAAKSFQKLLTAVQRRRVELVKSLQQQQSNARVFQNTKSQLVEEIERRRKSLRDAEESVLRYEDQQRQAAQRLAALKIKAVELEKEAAALRAEIGEARRNVAAAAAKQQRLVQFVECVGDGVILRPQLTSIPFSQLPNGVLASIAKQRGVYFVVRPNGFRSFNLAYDIALDSGRVIGFEPAQPSAQILATPK